MRRTLFALCQSLFVKLALASLLGFALFSPAVAQDWAAKMFAESRHDFGTVARGAKAEFAFEFTNVYKEDVHVAGLRTSCGCVTATLENATLSSRQTGKILAKLNTAAYLGQRSATVTVVIDKPLYAEVQLGVAGYIRQDVTLEPNQVRFGAIDEGAGAETLLNVSHTGRSDWKIVDVRSANQHLDVGLEETQRSGGRVGYRLQVRLKPETPAGIINDELKLITNDSTQQAITVAVQGQIKSALTASPRLLTFGKLAAEEAKTMKLIVRGKRPFQIVDIRCQDTRFSATVAGKEAALQVIPITLTADEQAGTIHEEIEVETSSGTVTVQVQAEISTNS